MKDFFTVFATDPATNFVGAAIAGIGMTQLGVVPEGQSDNLTGNEEIAQNDVDHQNVSAAEYMMDPTRSTVKHASTKPYTVCTKYFRRRLGSMPLTLTAMA